MDASWFVLTTILSFAGGCVGAVCTVKYLERQAERRRIADETFERIKKAVQAEVWAEKSKGVRTTKPSGAVGKIVPYATGIAPSIKPKTFEDQWAEEYFRKQASKNRGI